MNVRLDFTGRDINLDLGDIFALTEHLKATGPVADWQMVLTAMRDNDIAGVEVTGDEIRWTSTTGATIAERIE